MRISHETVISIHLKILQSKLNYLLTIMKITFFAQWMGKD